jgi:hypothetical protein
MARDTGRLLWLAQIRETDRGGMRPPVMLKDRVAIPTSSTLEIYEPTEGAFIKSVPLKVAARSNAVGMGTMVFLGGDFEGAGRVVALDITRPYVHTTWQLMIPKGGLKSTPALVEEVLFIGGGDGNVYAVSAVNRESLWSLKDGTFKTDEQLEALYAEQGYDESKATIAYCRIGERSSHTWFVLRELLGKSDVKNYDGSWVEYGSLVGVPIEK